jgi:hypothetical protein
MLIIPDDTWEMRGRAYSADDYGKNNRGIFATKPISAGTVIGDYLGLLIPNEKEDEYETGRDVYLMYYDEHVSIWPDQTQPGVHIVNHSCEPNCAIATYRGHGLYHALRKIHAGEELTVSYLLGPIDDDCAPCPHACRCRARSCTGSMHLPIDRYVAWSHFDDRESKRTRADPVEPYQVLQPLDRYPARISDRGFHGIFGSAEQPASIRDGDRLPSVSVIRREIRRSGRRLSYRKLGLTVLGTEGTTLVLAESRDSTAPHARLARLHAPTTARSSSP